MQYRKKIVTHILCALIGLCLSEAVLAQQSWTMKHIDIPTRWAKDVDPENVLPEYPRPQMVRTNWENLNGLWQYAITSNGVKKPSVYQGSILVPYPVESSLSGVMKSLQPDQLLWYKRKIEKPAMKSNERLLLHFGAVDWQCTVYINGKEIGQHQGGYQSFSFDITKMLSVGINELVVRVKDPTNKGINPHGKQLLYPFYTSYTPSSGIWQTVWMEKVPVQYISALTITPDVDRSLVNILVSSKSNTPVRLKVEGKTVNGTTNKQISIPLTDPKLWSPDKPYLYDFTVTMGNDEVKSYFGMRKVSIEKDNNGIERIFLNNKYTYNLGLLDQGFWPDGLYTAPTDAALKFDIQAAKAMGFNTIRKHVKVEPARWYFYCDKLGILVWQDMVPPGNDSKEARVEFEKENKEIISQLHNYPSIITWVLFNEGWGAYDQGRLTKWLKQLDPSRIVNGHTGENYYAASPWEDSLKWPNSDLTDIHNYSFPEMPPHLAGKAMVLGEFGGIGGFPIEGHLWNDAVQGFAYTNVSASAMSAEYKKLIDSLKQLQEAGLSGSIFTQPYDVESEVNGLMTYDRDLIKLPLEQIRNVNGTIVPTAKNYASATKGFSITVIDTEDIDREYPERLSEFQKGRTDSSFLRRLALMAHRLKDNDNAKKISAEYIMQIKNPFTLNNLSFIKLFTKSTDDPGFSFLVKNGPAVDRILGPNEARTAIKVIIFNQELKKYAKDKQTKPDWQQLEKKLTDKYGQIGEEILWNTQSKYALSVKDWQMAHDVARKLINKYGQFVTAGELNAYAWRLFEQVDDKNMLTDALSWSKRSIDETNEPKFIDTYAHLLQKLGRTREAISWQEKAVRALPNDPDLANALAKMKKGEPTWTEVAKGH
jgi:hypothetical protein